MHSTVYCLSILKNLFTVLLIPSFTSVLCLRGWLHGEFQPGLIFQWRKIGLVGGAELRAPKARETSRGVRGHPPGKFWNLESLKWHFLRFWGRVYRILNVIKPLPLHIQPLPHLRRRRQGGLSPPFFPLLQSWGALAPPGSAAYECMYNFW